MNSLFIRAIDDQGRIVIPMEIRKALHLERNAEIEIDCEGNCIILMPHRSVCILCGETDETELTHVRGAAICNVCIELALRDEKKKAAR